MHKLKDKQLPKIAPEILPPNREERIAAAKNRFRGRAKADAQQLQLDLVEACRGDEKALHRIGEIAHRLTGTAGSYGYMDVTLAAAAIAAVVETTWDQQELVAAVERLCGEIVSMNGSSN